MIRIKNNQDFLDFYCEGKEISRKDKTGIPNQKIIIVASL